MTTSMQVAFKAYVRRDGAKMLYINGANGCSIGISSESTFSPYGKRATEGKRRLWRAAHDVISRAPVFTGDLAKHTEPGHCAQVTLDGGWVLVGTDVANVGGMAVPSDGGYLVAEGHIVPLGKAFEGDPR